jgi:hypothetical protein
LCSALSHLIEENILVLRRIEVPVASFPDTWDHVTLFWLIDDGPQEGHEELLNHPVHPVHTSTSRRYRELIRLREAANKFLQMLETTPATALGVPKVGPPVEPIQSEPIPAPRLRVSESGGAVLLDGEPLEVRRPGAAFLAALQKANGLWQSTPELWQESAELRDSRIDRIFNRLPPQLKVLVESGKGKGYRLKLQ